MSLNTAPSKIVISREGNILRAVRFHGDQIDDFYVEAPHIPQNFVGAFFQGVITKLAPKMQAAFVDMGDDALALMPVGSSSTYHEGQRILVEVTHVGALESDGHQKGMKVKFCGAPPEGQKKVGLVRPGPHSLSHFSKAATEIISNDAATLLRLQKAGIHKSYCQFESHPDLFEEAGAADIWDSLFVPTLPLPSGGSIVISPTRALTVIDVNSSSEQSGTQKKAFQTNLEAIPVVLDHLKWRRISGLIVIDFLRMKDSREQEKITWILKKEIDFYGGKSLGFTKGGLFEITRKRDGHPLTLAAD